MTADIIPFIPRRHRKNVLTDFSAPKAAADDLVMDHVDTSSCEYVWSDDGNTASTGNVNT